LTESFKSHGELADSLTDTARSAELPLYQAYWGLQRTPFSDESARQSLAASPAHNEALARLEFLVESRSRLGLLRGESGSGKSLVLAELARRIDRKGAAAIIVRAAAASADQLRSQLAVGLNLADSLAPADPWMPLADRLAELQLEGVAAVILVDDLDRAAEGGRAAVEQLLALAEAPLTIVVTARPASAHKIGSRLVEQAALRIDLAPWNEEETTAYLKSSLAKAGRQQPAFDDSAVRRLFELSGGAPRKVNQLAQLALLAGAGQNLLQVGADTIDAVEEELSACR
jgi:type II secretory pathway predicted ATPase ExeA